MHGDFSPFNILWHGNAPIVIDVGQGVVQHHPKAKEFLVRDVTRLVEWANKNGLDVNWQMRCTMSRNGSFTRC